MIGFERMKSQLRAMINHDSGRFRRYIAVLSDGQGDFNGDEFLKVLEVTVAVASGLFGGLNRIFE